MQTAKTLRNGGPTIHQRGFTLLELVVVLAIIGVLAAVAMPRLIDAQRDARIAKANAIYGSMRSTVALARSRCELDLAASPPTSPAVNCASPNPIITMDGYPVAMVNRHPAATAAGIDMATQLNLAADGLAATNGVANGIPIRYFDVAGGSAPNCRIGYQEATLSGTAITAPTITVVTTGC